MTVNSADRENGWAVAIAGGRVRKLPMPQPWPKPLPDSDRVIYVAWDNARDVNQVRLASADQAGTTLFESANNRNEFIAGVGLRPQRAHPISGRDQTYQAVEQERDHWT